MEHQAATPSTRPNNHQAPGQSSSINTEIDNSVTDRTSSLQRRINQAGDINHQINICEPAQSESDSINSVIDTCESEEEEINEINNSIDERQNREDINNLNLFGNRSDIKFSDNLRLMFVNANGIPQSPSHEKNDAIFQFSHSHSIDILGMTEINRNWRHIPDNHSWYHRTKTWWEDSKASVAYNTNDSASTAFQPGGSITHAINKAAHRVIEAGRDPTNLGRWSWLRFQGKNNIKLRVITAYRPCKPSSAGPSTAYSQQERYFDIKERNICPREAILRDLAEAILKYKEEGDQIVLMMDCNEDVEGENMSTWLNQIGLREGILNLHHQAPRQPTYQRGTVPIDGIFVSNTLQLSAGGYMDFGSFPSDHRAIWIDLTFSSAFGCNMPEIIKPQMRKLKSNDPIVRNKWIELYKMKLREHKAFQLQYTCEEMANSGAPTYQIIRMQHKIHNIKTEARQYADKHCRKLRVGGVAYSDTIAKAGKNIQLWKGVIKKKLGCKFSSEKLKRLAKATDIENPMQYSVEEARMKQQEAIAHYYTLKKQASQLRKTYLQAKASAIANESNTDEDNIYKQLMQREKQREAARHIKATLHKLKSGSVSRVVIPHNDGTTKVLMSKQEIEEACIQENEKKYSQTEGTPCMIHPLSNILGFLGLTEEAEAILDGTFEFPAECHPYTREFFAQMKRVPQAQNLAPPAAISTETFKQGWKVMKEGTSACSSEGLHFGHLKACAQDEELANFEASCSHIPYCTGQSPSYWKRGKIVMIYKRAMVDLITKLRSIVLCEADFNFNTKILGKTTLEHAEKYNLLPKEQYGSRKEKSSIDHAIHKRITYDIMRQTRRAGGLCSNDAKSCFDRMVHSIIMLAYRRLGIPIPPVKCMLETIQQMKFQIRTLYGDSEAFIDGAIRLLPFQGNLQGCGASPCSWVIISAPLINMLRAADNGAHLVSPISKEYSHTVGFAFVDDTDILHFDMRNDPEPINQAMTKLQETINRWEGGLKITGGAIEPTKTWVYPIAFEFTGDGKWKYIKAEDIEFQFTVKDFEERICPINKIPLHQGKETLGVYLAADGSNQEMIDALTQKAEEWRDLILSGHLDKQKARTALQTTIMKSLEYPLPALTLTQAECNKIMKPVLTAGLLSTHVTRNYPRVVVYGDKSEGGLGINNLYNTGGLAKIAFLHEHLGLKDLSGEMIRTTIELHKIELGIGRNIFSLPFEQYGHLATDTWIKSIWQFAHENSIRIDDNTTHNIQLQRENDGYLMEIFSQYGFSKKELQQINRCRMHMQVTSISDIVTGDGKHISNCAKHCKIDKTRPSPFGWPVQPRPGPASRATWSRALRLCFPPQEDNSLATPLGKWITTTDHHNWFYKPSTHTIFQRTRRGWITWKRRRQVQHQIGQQYYLFGRGFFLPQDVEVATIHEINDRRVIFTGSCPQHETIRHQITLTTSPDTTWIDQNINLHPDFIAAYREAAQGGYLRTVSDGSFIKEEKYGSAAWIIDPSRQLHTIGSCASPGHPDEQNSYRSELVGILGAIKHNNDICAHINITQGKITLGCDGEGALKAIQLNYTVTKSARKHFDLIYAIRQAIQCSPLKWNFTHVKGHQDDEVSWEKLDRWARLNVMADQCAKQFLTTSLRSGMDLTPLLTSDIPYQSSSIRWSSPTSPESSISSQLVKTLHKKINSAPIRQYWEKKKKFSPMGKAHIDWETRSRSHSSLTFQRNQWLSKWLTGFCGVGITLQLYRHQVHSKCPRCNEDREDTKHVLQCPHQEAATTWHRVIHEVKDWILMNHGGQEMADYITASLHAWRYNLPYPPHNVENRYLRQAILQQDLIGWEGLLNGFLAKGWRTYIQSKLDDIGSQRSSILWMVNLQRRLWEIPWEMWNNRNRILHNDGNSTHQQEMVYLEEAIRLEWTTGLHNLPPRYSRLFTGSVDRLLRDPHIMQKQWITSVWAARSRCTEDMFDIDTSDLQFYQNWTARHVPRNDDEDEHGEIHP